MRRELVELVKSKDHWLEGAQLSNLDLSSLDLYLANLPSADLELSDLSNTFLAKANLRKAHLLSTNLIKSNLESADLTLANLARANFKNARLGKSNLSEASLRKTNFDGAYLYGMKIISATHSQFTNWGIPSEFIEGRFEESTQIYRTLKSHYISISDYRKSSAYYYHEMTSLHLLTINANKAPIGTSLRNINFWFNFHFIISNPIEWFGWTIHRFFWSYGISPFRILFWMAAVILLFGILVYPMTGIGPDTFQKIEISQMGIGPEKVQDTTICQSLSLSIVTFATLGYGNKTPRGVWGEFFGGLEALIGSVMAASFLVSLTLRYVHLS